MPTYRLLDARDEVLHDFVAADDGEACRSGRTLSRQQPRVEPEFGVRNDFRVERRDGERWQLVMAWVPG